MSKTDDRDDIGGRYSWHEADRVWDRCVQEAKEMMDWARKIPPGTVFKIVIHPAVLDAMRQIKRKKGEVK